MTSSTFPKIMDPQIDNDLSMQPARTKVVATIGPASESRIGELIDAGLSVARINFSHGEPDEHRRRVRIIREAAAERGVPIGILGDIQGPKLRLGLFPGGKLRLRKGDRMRLVQGDHMAERGEIPCNVKGFLDAVEPGHRVFLADGVVEMVVEARGVGSLVARVRRDGFIGDRKGINLPDSELEIELPTEKDLRDIVLARELELDMLGVSFVGSGADLDKIRSLAPGMMLVAKIERLSALDELEGILAASDGLMVARGDLGVEVELATLPMVQKRLIRKAMQSGKFSITATEMLESMVTSARPTRAEVTDVANAILDGTDAVMLSAETAVGRYPVESVQMMTRVAQSVESSQQYRDMPSVAFRSSEPTFSNATALAATQVARALKLKKIICFTETGNTVRQLSRYRPTAEIVAVTPKVSTYRSMSILADVRPILLERGGDLNVMLVDALDYLTKHGMLKDKEETVFVAGVPLGKSRSTNLLKLHRVGEHFTFG